MRTDLAFAMGEQFRGNELMVFDWDKAAKLIRENCGYDACAGLRDDWEYTGGCIYSNGKPINSEYTYLASTWAVPELEIDGAVYPCYRMQSETPGWDADTTWPESALKILMENNKEC